jgi:hypothetical protein
MFRRSVRNWNYALGPICNCGYRANSVRRVAPGSACRLSPVRNHCSLLPPRLRLDTRSLSSHVRTRQRGYLQITKITISGLEINSALKLRISEELLGDSIIVYFLINEQSSRYENQTVFLPADALFLSMSDGSSPCNWRLKNFRRCGDFGTASMRLPDSYVRKKAFW